MDFRNQQQQTNYNNVPYGDSGAQQGSSSQPFNIARHNGVTQNVSHSSNLPVSEQSFGATHFTDQKRLGGSVPPAASAFSPVSHTSGMPPNFGSGHHAQQSTQYPHSHVTGQTHPVSSQRYPPPPASYMSPPGQVVNGPPHLSTCVAQPGSAPLYQHFNAHFSNSVSPPSGASSRQSPASSIQGQNQSSSRSTPTHGSKSESTIPTPYSQTPGTGSYFPQTQQASSLTPTVPAQHALTGPAMPASHETSSFRQQASSLTPTVPAQHALTGPAMPSLPHHPVSSLAQHQKIHSALSPPPLQGQQRVPQAGPGAPPLPGQPYTTQTVHRAPPLPGQQYVSHATRSSAPPLPGQTYISQTGLGAPPLPGQQYHTQTGSMTPYVPNQAAPSAPPLPGQPLKPYSSALPPPPLPRQSLPTTSAAAAQHTTGLLPPPGSGSINSIANRPPTPGHGQYGNSVPNLTNSMAGMGISEALRPINLMQEARILPVCKPKENPLRFETTADRGILIPPNRKNCHPEVFRCTLKGIPHTQTLLQKVKLPLGLVIHPFKDLSSLPVISAGTIVRCKRCRTYINPFVSFLDERRWRCNMCFVVNDTPEEFLHHPVSKTYGEPHTRPECTNSTIEFIAPQEYMLRPPQPAVYLFLLDVSHSAIETGYLQIVCDSLLDHLDHLPGDSRTRIGFLTYNQTVHFYRMSEGLAQPQMLIVSDIDDVFIPTPENLLVNLRERKSLVQDLLHQLPTIHNLDVVGETDTYSALGSALEVAKKLMSPSGGRVTVFQQSLPSIGHGKLVSREDPNTRAGEVTTAILNPATDFYKKMALDCSAQQVAIDFFFFNSHYVDIATLSCSSRFSAGDVHYYPSLHVLHNPMEADRLAHDLERYLTRKIGFESVMRIRCTKGLSVHTFHGNFFVRSTDLLSLANVNPDAGYAVNLSIEDPLTDLSAVCFQAALLYTTSKGERRIRVHTMCIPVVKTPAEVFNSIDCVAVVSLLSKMAVDRSVTASLSDARDALVNAVIDPLKAYKETLPQGMTTSGVYVPPCLRLFPLYVHSLLKQAAFRSGVSTKLDDRVFAMINLKMQPGSYLMQTVHPDLYRVDNLSEEGGITVSEREVPQPDILPLSAESLSMSGSFLLDCGWRMFLLVGRCTNQTFIKDVLGFPQFSNIEEPMYSIPERENPTSELFQSFMEWLQDMRPHHAAIRVIRDDSRDRHLFLSYLRQDRTESSMSLQEFLLHVQQKLNG